MTETSTRTATDVGIAAVERDTGIAKDTLRVWERRYGFPRPARNHCGDRVYPVEQVEHLRRIKRLVDAGHRPARVVPLSAPDLEALARDTFGKPPAAISDPAWRAAAPYIDLLRRHRADALHQNLSLDVLRLGLSRFVSSIVAPLNAAVGEAWMRGQLEVHEEHLYTEIVQRVLRAAITAASRVDAVSTQPRVLLATVPQEPHTLGLLMAEAILVLEGCRCVQLGAQVPLTDIVAAASAHAADVLVLSFSSLLPPAQVLEPLSELRARLPLAVGVWVGGSSAALSRAGQGIDVVKDFAALTLRARNWQRPCR